jgi:hypothetical protein
VKKIEVTIRLDEAAGVSDESVAAALEAAGLSNISRSKRFRMIHGEVDEARQDELRRVKGVASVRPSQKFQVSGP